MQGNRLRAAARTIVMSGRYARSMALLKQRDMVIKFEVKGGQVSLHPVRTDFRSEDESTEVAILFGSNDSVEEEKEKDHVQSQNQEPAEEKSGKEKGHKEESDNQEKSQGQEEV